MKNYILLLVLSLSTTLIAQQTPADIQQQSLLITNAVVHTGTGTVLENGAVGFDNGIITYVGSANVAPAFEKTIDAKANISIPVLLLLIPA